MKGLVHRVAELENRLPVVVLFSAGDAAACETSRATIVDAGTDPDGPTAMP